MLVELPLSKNPMTVSYLSPSIFKPLSGISITLMLVALDGPLLVTIIV